MATVTITAGHTVEDLSYILGSVSVRPPFKASVGILSKEYINGADFSTGDTVVIEIPGSDGIRFVGLTTATGTAIAFTEGVITGGKKITFTAPSTNVKSLIVFNT